MIWILPHQLLVWEMTMTERSVGKLLNITYDTEKKTMRILIDITDDNFKEEIMRNFELKDKIIFKGEDVMWVSPLKK